MKKFYISIFTAVLLFATLMTQAQVYNSIDDGNPNGYTLDDPRFWVGGVPPPNNLTGGCTGCTINISSPVTMVHCCGFTTSTANVFTTQTPSRSVFNDGPPGNGITVGMKFRASIASTVKAVKYYRLTTAMNGPVTGLLYDNSGQTLLGSVAFPTATTLGWQTMNFTAPIPILANHTYVIAVFLADGNYTSDLNFFTAPVTNSVLTAVADGTPDGNNGAFTLGAAPAFPVAGNVGSNYWVDLDFSVDGTFLNDVQITNSTVNLYGTTDFNVNTYFQLFNSSITIGNEPTFVENLFVNDQVVLYDGSAIRLANTSTIVNANNDPPSNTVVGPIVFPAPGNPRIAGIYTVRPATLPVPGDPTDPNAGQIDFTLNKEANGNSDGSYLLIQYQLNCLGDGTCASGLVFGPAITEYDAINNFYGFAQSTTLPVVLVKLIAANDGNGGVKVSWSTSQEQNSGYFDVERSSDQSGWAKIGSVKAKGYSSTTTDYSFTDKIPLDGQGYYRLKMVDIDGKFKYSKAVSVDNGKNDQPLVIYSNPFSDQIRLKVNVSRAQNLTLSVSDILGKTYITQSYNAQQGDNFINLRSNTGGSGMYILRIHGDSYEQTVKLEKQ